MIIIVINIKKGKDERIPCIIVMGTVGNIVGSWDKKDRDKTETHNMDHRKRKLSYTFCKEMDKTTTGYMFFRTILK